jgi:hypothetical protein
MDKKIFPAIHGTTIALGTECAHRLMDRSRQEYLVRTSLWLAKLPLHAPLSPLLNDRVSRG